MPFQVGPERLDEGKSEDLDPLGLEALAFAVAVGQVVGGKSHVAAGIADLGQ